MGARAKIPQETKLPLDSGAPDALRWISEREVAARKKVEAAQKALELAYENQRNKPPELDGADYEANVRAAITQKDEAWKSWQEAANMLHKFDKSVEPERRDTTEKITREEGEKLLQLLAIYEREGTEQLITRFCQDVLSCQRPEQVHQLIAEKLREVKRGAIESAVREGHLPAWCGKALEGVI